MGGLAIDGPGVLRMAALELAADAGTLARVAPMEPGTLAGSVLPRHAGGVRVASINLHMATPAGYSLDPVNERVESLRDVARWVNAVNPDVLLVQELRDRPLEAARRVGGLGDVAATFGRLIGADDAAFTPALLQDPATSPLRHYGVATYARNGFAIDQAINARLPTSTPDVELRSVGVVGVRPPDGRAPLTVMGTHLANRVVEDQPLRDAQLQAIARLADEVAAGGRVAYADAWRGHRLLSERDFPARRIVLGGDFNQLQATSDRILRPAGFVHVNDALQARGDGLAWARAAAADVDTSSLGTPQAHRIDHAYVRGAADVRDSAAGPVPAREVDGDPTDHLGLVVDLD